MIAVDTNLIIRLLTKDDANQHQKTLKLFEHNTVFISYTVLLETEWVLRFSYEFSATEIYGAISSLVGLPNVEIESPSIVASTLALYEKGMEFSDALDLSQSSHCTDFYTFDKRFIAKGKNNDICNVRKP